MTGANRKDDVFGRWVGRPWWAGTLFLAEGELIIWEPRKEAKGGEREHNREEENSFNSNQRQQGGMPKTSKSVGTHVTELTYRAKNLKFLPRFSQCLHLLRFRVWI